MRKGIFRQEADSGGDETRYTVLNGTRLVIMEGDTSLWMEGGRPKGGNQGLALVVFWPFLALKAHAKN